MGDFCRYWKVSRSYQSLDEVLNNSYDIVSICTPDNTHQAIVEKVLDSGCIKYIWVEKPLTIAPKGAEKVIQIAHNKGISLWLSNQRRWEPEHMKLKRKIENGAIGSLIHATGYYVKGVTHVGCTMIDTLRFLCGEVSSVMAFPPFDIGSFGPDHSLRGILSFHNGGTATIIGCDEKEYIYSIFEIDIVGTSGRIKIGENGDVIYIYETKEYSHYSGFKELKLVKKINTEMKWSIRYGLDLLLKDLIKEKFSVYFAKEGFRDLQIVEALRQSAKKGGINIAV